MTGLANLPAALEAIDVGRLRNAAPEALLDQPHLASDGPPESAAARALVFGRAGDSDLYDEIGFRTFAAAPRHGAVPLQTFAMMRREHRHRQATIMSEAIRRIQSEQEKLRHRPLAPPGNARLSYRITRDTIDLVETLETDEGFEETRTWTFALSDPPAMLLHGAIDDDAGLIAAQQLRVEIPGAHWLPLRTVVESGRFPRFQDCRAALETETFPQRFYLFISHRWLSTEAPDPQDRQASLTAWQLFGYLCEAVRIAHWRGLEVPRKKNPYLGCAIGLSGSEIAESLIVNVLRPVLTPDALAPLAEEARAVESSVADYGVSAARSDPGLARLRALLDQCPRLSGLLDRVCLWYDYSCIPQAPRSEEEEAIFNEALRYLGAFQVMGHTAILLDEAESYLQRAWCVLESLVADTTMNAIDLLVGSERPTLAGGRTEAYFDKLMADRPHFVWRAVLDTEVFAVQSVRNCMRRLGLDATKPEDVDFIYTHIRDLKAPSKIHTDDSEVVTGVLPLVALPEAGSVLIPHRAGRTIEAEAEREVHSLDWTQSLQVSSLPHEGAPEPTAGIPPLMKLGDSGGDRAADRPCHLAIVAGCEGEACLLASWAISRRAQLRQVLGLEITSLSWVSSDIAPVGHLAEGCLQAVPVEVTAWVVVTLAMRVRHCGVTGMLLEALKTADHWHATIAVDRASENVVVHAPAGDREKRDRGKEEAFEEADLSRVVFPRHPGGLFRWALPLYLAQPAGDDTGSQRSTER